MRLRFKRKPVPRKFVPVPPNVKRDPDYPLYGWTPDGRCYSYSRTVEGGFKGTHECGGRWLRLHKISNGYLVVTLTIDTNQSKTVTVHSRMMRTYGPPRPSPRHEIGHSPNPDKTCNHIKNLVWCTRKENIAEYNRAVGPNGKQWGGTRKKKFSDAVKTALREDYKKGMSKVSLAKKYHMSIITVYRFLGFPWAKTLHGEK